MNDNTDYCAECGCEILSQEDVGFEYTEAVYRSMVAGLPKAGGSLILTPAVVCRACSEETDQGVRNESNSATK